MSGKLPSERELAARLGINNRTLRRAMETMVDEGLVVKEPRVGNFVRPDAISQRRPTIALLAPRWYRGWFSSDGAINEASRAGQLGEYSLMEGTLAGVSAETDPGEQLVTTCFYEPGHFWDQAGELVLRADASGVLLWPDSFLTAGDVRRLQEHGLAVVLMSRFHHLGDVQVSQVYPDTECHLSQQLVRLIELGHRDIRLALYEQSFSHAEVVALVRRFVEQHPELGSAERILALMPNHGGRYVDPGEVAERVAALFQGVSAPTAIIVPDGTVAAAVVDHCRTHQLVLGRDVSLAVFGNSYPRFPTMPALTIPDMLHFSYEAGRMAITLLREASQNPPGPTRTVALSAEMIWTDSIGSAPR